MNMSQFAIELVSRIKDLVGPEIAAIKELMAAKDLEITSLKEEISHVRKSIPSPVDLEPQQLQIKNLSEQIQILRGEMLTEESLATKVAAIVIPEPIEGREGPVGKDGRDAVDIEIQPSIDQSKQYPRGTYAIHEGGLWKSFQSTNKMHGWECVVSGVKGFAIDQTDDRNFSLSIEDSKGIKAVYDFSMPVLIYKGVWRQGKYEKGDSVTTAGSVWYANRTTQEKPGTGNDDWTLAVKKGLDLRGTK